MTEFSISSPLLSWFKSSLSYRDRHVVIVYKNGEGELMRSTRMQKRKEKTRQTSLYDNNVKLVDAAFYQ